MTGRIKWFSSEKGWGFIRANDGNEYFFHKNSTHDPVVTGDPVVFDVSEQGPRGPSANNVRLAPETINQSKEKGAYAVS